MDVQLQELIEKIKKDGVSAAETKAAEIISESEKKAEAIIAEAQEKAAEIVKNAKVETQRMEKASEEAIVQAGRNMLLSFKDSLLNELNSLIHSETEAAMDKSVLTKLIPETVKEWAKNSDASELSVLLSEKDAKDLESVFTSELKAEIAKGLEVKPDKTLSAGFRIGVKNGVAYYDYSAESLAEMFAAYLNPKVAGLMKTAASDINAKKDAE
ncbi:MAG: V-type ATP synthase subunit E [Treponema sp.]|nr:V-type ATP synthase subunit E [Treponema sp.]